MSIIPQPFIGIVGKPLIPVQIDVIYNNIKQTETFLIENEYYNIYTYGETRERALIEANYLFDCQMRMFLKTDDKYLTYDAIELKQKYINYYGGENEKVA